MFTHIWNLHERGATSLLYSLMVICEASCGRSCRLPAVAIYIHKASRKRGRITCASIQGNDVYIIVDSRSFDGQARCYAQRDSAYPFFNAFVLLCWDGVLVSCVKKDRHCIAAGQYQHLYLAFPYQYVWFNEVARQFKVERYFETDYWGAAGRGLANQLNIESKRISPLNCIYGDPDSLILPFLDNDAAKCFQGRGGLNSDPPRPYLAASFSLSSFVVNCPEIYREKFKLFLGNGDITVGKIQYCK